MVALISSTLIPEEIYSIYNPTERLEQTINTVQKLRDKGFEKIFLFDNSIKEIGKQELVNADPDLIIFQTPQYSFKNKGINEALLILNNIHHIPKHVPVFKLSGRYFPGAEFSIDTFNNHSDKDFIGIGYDFDKKVAGFSTKAYFVKDADVLRDVLALAVEDMIAYSKGVYGIKSFVRMITNMISPALGSNFQLSLEQSFARIIKKNHTYKLLNEMHIEGFEAGVAVKTNFHE